MAGSLELRTGSARGWTDAVEEELASEGFVEEDVGEEVGGRVCHDEKVAARAENCLAD